ncbi:MAG: hypothetical protein JST70_14085 [Bacteroidetes bacterium]|nr:hypothetical protein [Bacteroidota bacterium]
MNTELDYIHFNIFGLGLSCLATGTGSISERISRAYNGYFHKISWEKDLAFIPHDYKSEFLLLKKKLHDDIVDKIDKERNELRRLHPELTEDLIREICNCTTVLKTLHWKKSKAIVELISNIYFGLGLELKEQGREKVRQNR